MLLRQECDEVPKGTLSCPDRNLAVFHHYRHYEGLRLLPSVCDSKLIQQTLIKGLLNILLDCAFNQDKKFRNHLKSVISKTFLKVAKREENVNDIPPTEYKFFSNEEIASFDIENLSPYSKLRTIIDLISGMTDRYAVSMYQKLSGQRL